MFTDTRTIAKKPTRRQLADIDRRIEACYYRHCHGTTIAMMDIGRLYAAARQAALAGDDPEPVVVAKIAEYNRS
jgi:hypothetical protein